MSDAIIEVHCNKRSLPCLQCYMSRSSLIFLFEGRGPTTGNNGKDLLSHIWLVSRSIDELQKPHVRFNYRSLPFGTTLLHYNIIIYTFLSNQEDKEESLDNGKDLLSHEWLVSDQWMNYQSPVSEVPCWVQLQKSSIWGVFIIVFLTINGVLKRVYNEAVFIALFRTPFHRLPLRSL